MSYAAAKIALQNWFYDEWVTGLGKPADSVAYENKDFDIPDNEWVRFIVRPINEQPLEMGLNNTTYQMNGMVMMQFFVKSNEATPELLAMIDAAAALFRGEPVSGYHFNEGLQHSGYQLNKDGWYQANVNFPFYRDEQFNL